MKKVKLYIEEEITDLATSNEKIYAICKTNGWPLRITFFKEAAQLWKSETTKICACKIRL